MGTKKGEKRKTARRAYEPREDTFYSRKKPKPAVKDKKTGKVTFGTGWGSEKSMKFMANITRDMEPRFKNQYAAVGSLVASYDGLTGEDAINLLKRWGKWE